MPFDLLLPTKMLSDVPLFAILSCLVLVGLNLAHWLVLRSKVGEQEAAPCLLCWKLLIAFSPFPQTEQDVYNLAFSGACLAVVLLDDEHGTNTAPAHLL